MHSPGATSLIGLHFCSVPLGTLKCRDFSVSQSSLGSLNGTQVQIPTRTTPHSFGPCLPLACVVLLYLHNGFYCFAFGVKTGLPIQREKSHSSL